MCLDTILYRREEKGEKLKKKILSISLFSMILFATLITTVPPASAQAGTIYLTPATVSWQSPPHIVGEKFTVEVRITDVADCYMIVFSVKWNPTILDLVDPVTGNPADPVKGDCLEPGGATAFMPNTDHAAGLEDGCAYTLLGVGIPGVNIGPAPGGLVAKMTFKVLKAPEAGSDIDTDILFEAVTHDTLWVDSVGTSHNFVSMTGTHFHFEVVTVPPYSPIAKKTHYPSVPKVNETVTFDASASEQGWDGDSMCPIVEYRWDFGDGTPQLVVSDPVITHVFNETGTYTVCLEVYAPGTGGFIDQAYNPLGEICQDINVIFVTGLVDDLTSCSHPPPWNGEGPGVPCDAFEPQQEICLCCYVTYNKEPVQHKLNVFEIHGPRNPYYNFTFTRVAETNETGYACISFRVPWPCIYPEEAIFGDWIVYSWVEVAEMTAEDYMEFKVGWLIEIIDIETGVLNGGWTPQSSFKKGECIGVKLTVRNIAFTSKVAFFSIVVYDDLGVPVAYWKVFSYTVHPGEKDIIMYCYLFIPKWAFIGIGTIYANALKDGTAYCPEASTTVTLTAA